MVIRKDAIDSLMYVVDRVSVMVIGKKTLIPIVKCLVNQKDCKNGKRKRRRVG